MTGLKTGSGDDLWGDDSDEDESAETEEPVSTREELDAENEKNQVETSSGKAEIGSKRGEISSTGRDESSNETQSYIVRRAIKDKSVQFERDERLTFFVHDDVTEGERQLLSEMEAALGRDVPKFDVREAVYRAALRNREDVLIELLEMGYSLEES